MRIFFDSITERSNVVATLQRLIDDIDTRSHSTAEVLNLTKALMIVKSAPIDDFENRDSIAQ